MPISISSIGSQPTTGVFGMQTCKSIAAILDGTSNTVAFAEGTIAPAPNSVLPQKKYVGMKSVAGAIPSILYDASSNPSLTAAGIAACTTAFTTPAALSTISADLFGPWGLRGSRWSIP